MWTKIMWTILVIFYPESTFFGSDSHTLGSPILIIFLRVHSSTWFTLFHGSHNGQASAEKNNKKRREKKVTTQLMGGIYSLKVTSQK